MLIEHTDIDTTVESSEGNTFLDIAIRDRGTIPLVGWLLQKSPTNFDVDHRNARGKTLLMQQVCCGIDFAEHLNDMKDLVALGADLDARVLDRPETSPRDIGATALHFAAESLVWSPEAHYFAKARYLLSQGANPHAVSSGGHTATDRVLEHQSVKVFLEWLEMLLALDCDLKAFVRREIDAHADVPWYAAYGCDEFVLGLFGFVPRFDEATGTVLFLPRPEAKAPDDIVPVPAQDRIVPAKDDIVPAQDDSSPVEEEFDLFGDTDSGSEQSADEDIRRYDWRTVSKPRPTYRTPSHAVINQDEAFGGLSQYTSATPEGSQRHRYWWMRPKNKIFETVVSESWTVRSGAAFYRTFGEYSLLIGMQSD